MTILDNWRVEKLFKTADILRKKAEETDQNAKRRTVGEFIDTARSIQMDEVLFILGLDREYKKWQKGQA